MSIYDQIKDMVMNLERLEHRLYKDYPHTSKILDVHLQYKKLHLYTCNCIMFLII